MLVYEHDNGYIMIRTNLNAWNDEGYVAINFPPLFDAADANAAFVK